MSPHVGRGRQTKLSLIMLALLAFPGCSSIGDFGRLKEPLVTDDIHAWVGREAAASVGAPISLYNLTDEERTLRDLAFPLIEPPYDRQRWDAIVYEYGISKRLQRQLWRADASAYYRHLLAMGYRSTAGRYNKLIDDVRDDVNRLGPFFDIAHRVLELDRRREMSMNYLPDLTPAERANALARIGENGLTIAWVQYSLAQRCAGYRFALDHLVVAEPENIAAQADLALSLLQQQVAANQLVPAPPFAVTSPPRHVATQTAPIVK
jgi:hypothetical protein